MQEQSDPEKPIESTGSAEKIDLDSNDQTEK
jgi:hypothetical protein